MGTPPSAVLPLQALIGSDDSVVAVVTPPDRPRGRGQKVQPPAVKVAAQEWGIPVLQPLKIRNNPGFLDQLRHLHPDLIVVAAYGQLLPKELLDLPPHGCINLHPSLLPLYRGGAPVAWAILNGEERTGVTIMRLNMKMDAGDILLQKEETILPNDTTETLEHRLFRIGSEALLETIARIKSDTLKPIPQDDSKATFAPQLKKEEGRIDWSQPAETIARQVRAFNPWPGASFQLEGRFCKVWKAHAERGRSPTPGSVLSTDGDLLKVGTGEGVLVIEELQLEGKRRMSAGAFLHGHPLHLGSLLGG